MGRALDEVRRAPHGELGERPEGGHLVPQDAIRARDVEGSAIEHGEAPLRDRRRAELTRRGRVRERVRADHPGSLEGLKIRDQPVMLAAKRSLHRNAGG